MPSPSPALAAARAEGFIDILFDGPPGPDGGRFVEVEDANHQSLRLGEWIERGDGYWALRVPRSSLPAEGETRDCRMCLHADSLTPSCECRCHADDRHRLVGIYHAPAEGIEVTVDPETGDEYAHGRCVGRPAEGTDGGSECPDCHGVGFYGVADGDGDVDTVICARCAPPPSPSVAETAVAEAAEKVRARINDLYRCEDCGASAGGCGTPEDDATCVACGMRKAEGHGLGCLSRSVSALLSALAARKGA